MPSTEDECFRCAGCGADMTDYEAVYERSDARPETDIPDYARCRACGKMHPVED